MTAAKRSHTVVEDDETGDAVPDTSRAAAVFARRIPGPEEPGELLDDGDEAAVIAAIVRGR